jgi:exodeoxyribonuclease V alpha subunit
MGAFAMTVHKSQGSQFKRVALVLAGRDSPIQTRELVYTGITRTSSRLDWLGDAKELRRALDRPIQRASGLRELLR